MSHHEPPPMTATSQPLIPPAPFSPRPGRRGSQFPRRLAIVARIRRWYPSPMATTFMTLDDEGRATLPEGVRSELGVEAGDVVLIERTERGTFELIPADLVPRDQLWFYHPEMQGRITRAELDVAEGRFTQTGTSEDEVQAFLDSLKAGAGGGAGGAA